MERKGPYDTLRMRRINMCILLMFEDTFSLGSAHIRINGYIIMTIVASIDNKYSRVPFLAMSLLLLLGKRMANNSRLNIKNSIQCSRKDFGAMSILPPALKLNAEMSDCNF